MGSPAPGPHPADRQVRSLDEVSLQATTVGVFALSQSPVCVVECFARERDTERKILVCMQAPTECGAPAHRPDGQGLRHASLAALRQEPRACAKAHLEGPPPDCEGPGRHLSHLQHGRNRRHATGKHSYLSHLSSQLLSTEIKILPPHLSRATLNAGHCAVHAHMCRQQAQGGEHGEENDRLQLGSCRHGLLLLDRRSHVSPAVHLRSEGQWRGNFLDPIPTHANTHSLLI